MKKFLFGFALGIVLVPATVFLYFASGGAPVATSAAPMPLEKRLAKMALNATIDREAPRDVPIKLEEANYVAGASIYRRHCADCHGLPGQRAPEFARGMFPTPPQLFEGKGVTDDIPGETYWKAKNGIRMTGMPAFQGTLTDQELWQVSVLLANADKLPDSVKQSLFASPSDSDPSKSKRSSNRLLKK